MSRIRKGNGRKKIEIKKISKERNLQVTFSRRRNGLFNKASDLCTLCAAEVSLVIFSPSKKVFSFGHSSVNYVVNRFLSGALPQTSGSMQEIEANRNSNAYNLNAQLSQLSERLDTEKNRVMMLDTQLKPTLKQCCWAGPIEEMSMPQLELLMVTTEKLERFLTLQANMIRYQDPNPPQYLAGSSSSSVGLPQQAPPEFIQPPNLLDGNMMPPLPDGQRPQQHGRLGPRFY